MVFFATYFSILAIVQFSCQINQIVIIHGHIALKNEEKFKLQHSVNFAGKKILECTFTCFHSCYIEFGYISRSLWGAEFEGGSLGSGSYRTIGRDIEESTV